jgi:transcriptional regulator with XRE-family HTH domain
MNNKRLTILLTRRDLDCICSLLGITRRELAKRIGYSESHISHSRKREIPLKMSRKIAERFGLTDSLVLEMRRLQMLFDSITKAEGDDE